MSDSARSETTVPVPKEWLAATAKLLNEMAGEGVGIEGCDDPADLMTELAVFFGVADLDDCWAAAVRRACAL